MTQTLMRFRPLLATLMVAFAGCATGPGPDSSGPIEDFTSGPPVQSSYKVDATPGDPDIATFLAPYKTKVDVLLLPLAQCDQEMRVIRREAPLTNWVADTLLAGSQTLIPGKAPQAVVLNAGGVRSDMPAGDVSTLTIMSIAPFDNTVVLVTMDKSQLDQVVDTIAAQKGRAIVSGLEIHADAEGKVERYLIAGQPPTEGAAYTMATISFLSEGNGGFDVMKPLPKQDSGRFMRDVLADQVKAIGLAGGRITPPTTINRQFFGGVPAGDLK